MKVVTLRNGQQAFIFGAMDRKSFDGYCQECIDDMPTGTDGTALVQAVFKKRFEQHFRSDILDWITENNIEITYWIDGHMFDANFSSQFLYEWGICFQSDSEFETLFALRWA